MKYVYSGVNKDEKSSYVLFDNQIFQTKYAFASYISNDIEILQIYPQI